MKLQSITLALLTFCTLLHAAERVPGTRVSLDTPLGFVATKQFPGFAMESTGSSIIVTEIPGPFSELSKGLTKEGLATRGMTLLEKSDVKIASGNGRLIRAKHPANGINFLNWMLVFGNESESVMVLAAFPEELEKDQSEKLKQALLSVTWDVDAKVDESEGLTFNVKESADLKIASTVGNMLIMTRNGVMPQKDPSEPLLVVGSSISEDWTVPGDKAIYARERLVKADVLADAEITSEKTVKFDGLSGYLMEAEGKDRKSGVPLYAMQCMLFTSDGYYVLQGFVGADEKAKYSKVFLAVTKSFKQVE